MYIKMAMMVSLLSLGLLSQNTYAQTPSDESIAQWALITDFKNDFEQGVAIGYIQPIKVALLSTIKETYPNATTQQLVAAERLIEEAFQKPVKRIAKNPQLYQRVRQALIESIKRHFTQQELDALIEFYSSPIGKSIHKKQMVFYQDIMANIPTVVMEMDELGMTDKERLAVYAELFPQLEQIFKQ